MVLERSYFINNDTVFLARNLLGKTLFRKINDQIILKGVITETEAYHGETDKACHAKNGKTKRNQVMYHDGGVWYVYLCYGVHWLLNIVTGEAEFPAAVLIRGINDINGPGKVTKHLQVDNSLYGKPAIHNSELWIEDNGFKAKQIEATPRIGIDYAGSDALKPWRFILKDNIIQFN